QVKTHAWHEDDEIRAASALALGQMIADKTVNHEVKQAIDCLAMLTRDRVPQVRQVAVQALGKIRSEDVIPPLTRALRDPDLEIVALASAILQNYKTYAVSSPVVSDEKQPENSALKAQNQSL
ncbi:MAG: HEAT repeat domain-containing protein, partial [Halothece sp. Uz-M2-17]|nr:HEAT repeat domain-containing protein [Halothece sp. Uz-M2-17]